MFMHVRRPSHRIGSVCFSALARSRPLLYYHFTLRQHQVIMRREKCASCSSTLSRYTIPFSLQAAGTSLGIGRLLSCFISTMLGQILVALSMPKLDNWLHGHQFSPGPLLELKLSSKMIRRPHQSRRDSDAESQIRCLVVLIHPGGTNWSESSTFMGEPLESRG
jgi:hypothetical protein